MKCFSFVFNTHLNSCFLEDSDGQTTFESAVVVKKISCRSGLKKDLLIPLAVSLLLFGLLWLLRGLLGG